MRIKRFEASDITKAMAMVKEEMGEDAVILATKTLGTGKKGKNGKSNIKPRVEIVAARDYDLEDIVTPAPTPAEDTAPQTYDYRAVRTPIVKDKDQAQPQPEPKVTNKKETLHTEAQDLRIRFANLFKRTSAKNKKEIRLDGQYEKARQTRQDVSKKPSKEDVIKWRDQVIDKIQLSANSPGDSPLTIALVGATGVGKTTTAAKLAAWYSLRQGQSVALLSMDCYRIGATDQLRTYARIMRLPCEVALRKNDLEKALARHQDKDVIIIDTAGRSPYDQKHITELQEWFAPCQEIEPHLVLSATTKKEDLDRAIKSYTDLGVNSLILTKLDETRAYATLCQQVVASSLPIAYLCTGQRVPEDFQVASKDYLDTLFKKGWAAATEIDD